MSTVLTLAPMSPAVARLWHQLQSEMLKETHGMDTVPEGAIVLPALPKDCPAYFRNGTDITVLTVGDDDGNSDRYTKRYSCPKNWNPEWWNPAHWARHLTRRDAQGRSWTCSGGDYLLDDFGFLVEVTQ